MLLASLAAGVIAAAVAVSLRERPFRDPPPVAVSEPVETESAEDALASAEKDEPEKKEPGAPDAAVIPVETGQSRNDGTIVIRDPSAVERDPQVAHLPDRALIEESESGPLPVRGPGGRRPFDAYARPWSGTDGARIAVVIGGLGVSQTGTQQAIARLRPEITLAFASSGNSLDRWMQEARRQGHEIVLQVPMEPFGYPGDRPGFSPVRKMLTVDAGARTNRQRLRWALSRVTNYTGVMNYMGGRFSADGEAMANVMSEIAARGLMYVDDGTSARSRAEALAADAGAPFVVADTLIDATDDRRRPERGEIRKRLDELERIARARGFAVGTGSAYTETIDTVAAWADDVTARGIELVPLSALAADPEKEVSRAP